MIKIIKNSKNEITHNSNRTLNAENNLIYKTKILLFSRIVY